MTGATLQPGLPPMGSTRPSDPVLPRVGSTGASDPCLPCFGPRPTLVSTTQLDLWTPPVPPLRNPAYLGEHHSTGPLDSTCPSASDPGLPCFGPRPTLVSTTTQLDLWTPPVPPLRTLPTLVSTTQLDLWTPPVPPLRTPAYLGEHHSTGPLDSTCPSASDPGLPCTTQLDLWTPPVPPLRTPAYLGEHHSTGTFGLHLSLRFGTLPTLVSTTQLDLWTPPVPPLRTPAYLGEHHSTGPLDSTCPSASEPCLPW
ncbi:unnamed protein product, partial [Iphiclides podalirius]